MGYLRCDNGRNEQCKCDYHEVLIPGVLHILSKNVAVTCCLFRVEQTYITESYVYWTVHHCDS